MNNQFSNTINSKLGPCVKLGFEGYAEYTTCALYSVMSSSWHITYEPWLIRCIPGIYHPRSRSSDICSFDKPLASLRVYQNFKLPLTSISGGIFREYTYKPWFIYYLFSCIFHVCVFMCIFIGRMGVCHQHMAPCRDFSCIYFYIFLISLFISCMCVLFIIALYCYTVPVSV